jgi:hypothetical protein
VLAACALTLWAVAAGDAEPLPQALHNQGIARSATLSAAIGVAQRVWPPLYPLFLWLVHHTGLPLHAANGLLFVASLAVFAVAARQVAPRSAPWVVALYALGSFHVANLPQLVSEALLTPLALLFLLALGAYRADPVARRLVPLALACALACLTRYFALFWLLPIGLLEIVRRRRERGGCLIQASGFLAAAVAPVGLWMLDAYLRTGHPTGMDRFASRAFDAQTTLAGNLDLLMRTLAFDLFLPWRGTSHAALMRQTPLSVIELTIATAILIALACLVLARSKRQAASRAPSGDALRAIVWLADSYLVALIVLWTVGNNDPIHSRFVYPVYPFLYLGFAALVERSREPSTPIWARVSAVVAFAMLAGVQLSAAALHLGGGAAGAWP